VTQLDRDHIRAVVSVVLAEQRTDREAIIESAIARALTNTLGVEAADKKELRLDFLHLRKWRKAVEQGQSLTFKVVITTLVSGFFGLVVLGLKTYLGK
jgi:hypothetical protein